MAYEDGKILVPDDGRRDAKIVLVGEAPGTRETHARKPFVGPSGSRLREWWEPVGITRGDVYITNAIPYQPHSIDEIPRQEFLYWQEQLHARLAALDGPNVLVPVGNYALYAVTGLGRVSFHQRDGKWQRPGITSLRGSILPARIGGRDYKVIPSIHPAATFARGGKNRKRGAQYTRACVADWQRIAGDSKFAERALPQREYYIRPTLQDVYEFYEDARWATILSFDIETPRVAQTFVATTDGWVPYNKRDTLPTNVVPYKSGPKRGQPKFKVEHRYPAIACIGFSIDPSWAITIPTTREYWGNDYDEAMALVTKILDLPVPKVAQNGLFDTYWLDSVGMPVRMWLWDTRAMHHALDPTAMHSLEYLASVYTREPYWKDEAKDPDSATRYASNGDDAFWTYCGKDAAVTLEIQRVLFRMLDARGMLEWYHNNHTLLLNACLRLSRHGMRINEAERVTQLERIVSERVEIETHLEAAAGRKLVSKAAVSGTKLASFLYGDLAIPKQYTKDAATGGKRVTTGESALIKIGAKYGQRPVPGGSTVGEVCTFVLAHRGSLKDAEAMADGKTDADLRMRALYSPFSDSGRLRASATPLDTGRNMQNVPRGPARRIYLPDEGKVLFGVDESQAESRVVFALTGDKKLLEIARAKPWEYDMHSENAAAIFGVPVAEVTYEQRRIGKIISHAAQRQIGGATLSAHMAKEYGIIMDADKCQRFLNAYLLRHQALEPGYFRAIRQEALRCRMLSNSWGRVISFKYDYLEEPLYRELYSWLPQSNVADLTDQWGFVPLDRAILAGRFDARINIQGHDALVVSVVPTQAYDVALFLQERMEQTQYYWGNALSIPLEFSLGSTWDFEKSWKRLPSRDEFTAAALEYTR